MVGLIGPDGVGKSTLMGIIAGAKKIQSGKVQVLGGDIADRRHRNAVCPLIAYMPQGLGKNLYFELSVFENIDFFAQLFGLSRAERRTRIDGLLKATGLGPFPDRPAGKLSGGMKQKVGLCSSLIHDPDLLILDEPTTGVDPLSRQQFWTLDRRHPRRQAGDERARLDGVHGRSRSLRLADRDGCRADPGHGHPSTSSSKGREPRTWKRPSWPCCPRRNAARGGV